MFSLVLKYASVLQFVTDCHYLVRHSWHTGTSTCIQAVASQNSMFCMHQQVAVTVMHARKLIHTMIKQDFFQICC